MNRVVGVLLFLVVLGGTVFATTPRQFGLVKTLDNFEDGTILEKPEWWQFGQLNAEVVEVRDGEAPHYVGNYVLQLRGKTRHWYVGGMGVYMPMDATGFNYVKLNVKGYGLRSGSLVLELYDDDNNNGYIEHNELDPTHTLYDDKFIYTLKVNWSGWRVVMIPMHMFKDANPGIGDNIWNPNQRDGSAGFAQLQCLVLADSVKGDIKMDIDTIKMFYGR